MEGISSTTTGLITYLHIWCPILALIISLTRSQLFGRFSFAKLAEQFFLQLLFWVVGVENFIIFIVLIWFPEVGGNIIQQAAAVYSFQLGMVNLSFAVLGIASLLSSIGYQTATALGYSIWVFGVGLGHLRKILSGIEPTPHLQSMVYTDLIVPLVVLITLMFVYQNMKSKS